MNGTPGYARGVFKVKTQGKTSCGTRFIMTFLLCIKSGGDLSEDLI